jgi:hypothetical protein
MDPPLGERYPVMRCGNGRVTSGFFVGTPVVDEIMGDRGEG